MAWRGARAAHYSNTTPACVSGLKAASGVCVTEEKQGQWCRFALASKRSTGFLKEHVDDETCSTKLHLRVGTRRRPRWRLPQHQRPQQPRTASIWSEK